MQAHYCAQDHSLEVNVPEGTENVRIFLNGVPSCSLDVPSGDRTLSVPMQTILLTPTICHLPLQSTPGLRALVQMYALDAAGARIGETGISVELSLKQKHQRSNECVSQNRILATAMHGLGDIHRWDIPISSIRGIEQCYPGTGLALLYACVVFDLPAYATGSIASVSWGRGAIGSNKRKRRTPVPAAWGTVSPANEITATTTESAFATLVDPCGVSDNILHLQIEALSVASVWPLGGLRYAVYAYMVPQPSSLLPTILSPPVTNNHQPPAEPHTSKRLAVLCGISKYTRRRGSDLEYADDDIVHWYEYLTKLGFECKVFGDEFSPCRKRTFFFL